MNLQQEQYVTHMGTIWRITSHPNPYEISIKCLKTGWITDVDKSKVIPYFLQRGNKVVNHSGSIYLVENIIWEKSSNKYLICTYYVGKDIKFSLEKLVGNFKNYLE